MSFLDAVVKSLSLPNPLYDRYLPETEKNYSGSSADPQTTTLYADGAFRKRTTLSTLAATTQ